LATIDFSANEKMHLGNFISPVPYRTVGLVVHRHFVKKKLLAVLKQDIIEKITTIISQINIEGERLDPIS
jgi:LysR family hydrogen peroxide-inducible transcriptional activator